MSANTSIQDIDSKGKVNASCLSFLLMEAVPLSLRVTSELSASKPTDDYHFGGVEQLKDLELLKNENNNERIESYGQTVGKALLEVLLFDRNEQLDFKNLLNIMKLIARDIWKSLYLKQIDNLKTNHRGTFILIDSQHKFLSQFDTNSEDVSKSDVVSLYLRFDCGVIAGVLKQCSLTCSVDAEYKTDGSVHYTIVLE